MTFLVPRFGRYLTVIFFFHVGFVFTPPASRRPFNSRNGIHDARRTMKTRFSVSQPCPFGPRRAEYTLASFTRLNTGETYPSPSPPPTTTTLLVDKTPISDWSPTVPRDWPGQTWLYPVAITTTLVLN